MKKYIFISLLISLMLVVSCSTSLDVGYLQPAPVDMGQSRKIAIAPTVPFSGRTGGLNFVPFSNFAAQGWHFSSSFSDAYLKSEVAEHATDMLYNGLANTGYFEICDPGLTDSILTGSYTGFDVTTLLKKEGVKAVIVPKVTGMKISENISQDVYTRAITDTSGKQMLTKDFAYSLKQEITVTFQYSVISVDLQQVVAVKSFSKTINAVHPVKIYEISSEYDLLSMFKEGLNSFSNDIVSQLVPVKQTLSIPLMENKPKSEGIEKAYKEVSNGNLREAKQLFIAHYQATGFVPSGYNSALISASLNDFDTAIKELTVLARNTDNLQVLELLVRLQTFKTKDEKAKSQIDGTSKGFDTDGSVNIFKQTMEN